MKNIKDCLGKMKAKLPAATAEALRVALDERATGKKRKVTLAAEIAAVEAVLEQEQDWRERLDAALRGDVATAKPKAGVEIQRGAEAVAAPEKTADVLSAEARDAAVAAVNAKLGKTTGGDGGTSRPQGATKPPQGQTSTKEAPVASGGVSATPAGKATPELTETQREIKEALGDWLGAAVPDGGLREKLGRPEMALAAPVPGQRYDEALPVERMPQIIALAQSLVSKGVRTPEALAVDLQALGPKAVGISQKLWQMLHSFGAEGALTPDWAAVYGKLEMADGRGVEDANQDANQDTKGVTPDATQETSGSGPAVTDGGNQDTKQDAKPRRSFKHRPAADDFGGEITPVSAFIIGDVGGILSKSSAKARGKFSRNTELWEDAPRLSHPTHNKIYSKNGAMPDAAAQALYDAGLLKEPYVSEMWRVIAAESQTARNQAAQIRVQSKEAAEAMKKRDAFDEAASDKTKTPIQVSDLGEGDVVDVGGERMKVTHIDADTFDVTLEDGKKFGVQTVEDGTVIYGEILESVPRDDGFIPDDVDKIAPDARTAGDDIPAGSNVERDRGGRTGDASGEAGVSPDGGTTAGDGGQVGGTGTEGGDIGSREPVPADLPAALGGVGGSGALRGEQAGAAERDAGDLQPGGRGEPDADGVAAEPDRGGRVEGGFGIAGQSGTLAQGGGTGESGVGVSPGIAAIRKSAPALTPEQAGDVEFVERRLIENKKPGVLLTNGTGTGKTFSGLGAVKRALDAGAKDIIIAAPSDKIGSDWVATAKRFFKIEDIRQLTDTKDDGKGSRVVVTTYANLAQNNALVGRPWAMVVADESHHLSQAKDGDKTNALDAFRALTWHRAGLDKRVKMALPNETERRAVLRNESFMAKGIQNLTAEKQTELRAVEAALDAKWKELDAAQKAMGEAGRPKALMLSATPFAYHFSLDYAEGYLFDYPPGDESGRYNAPTGRERFYVENLGYRMRTGKLTSPENATATGMLERRLSETLKKSGAMSGRALVVPFDYSRQFVVTESALGEKVDEVMRAIDGNARLGVLRPYINLGNYLARRFLLEGLKAREAIRRIKQHLALGRKVVVFHDYKVGGIENPLRLRADAPAEVSVYVDGKTETVKLAEAYQELRESITGFDTVLAALDRVEPPLKVLTKAFPSAVVVNGDVPKAKRRTDIARFNASGSGVDIVIAQRASAKEGISLHDTDGKHQRVFIDLGIPARPTDAIQSEGRIYRHGVRSNAVVEYLTTGTNFERWTFAQTIAQRASTAENLAMGEGARALLQSFADGYNAAEYVAPSLSQGTGGKAQDKARENGDPYQNAVALYYTNAKKTSRNKSAEGVDYFATPEPLGYKMVEWAGIRPGEKVLEPSAGHGAIARFFPDATNRHAIEPSAELAGRLALNATDAEIHQTTFENFNVVNKFDAIVMNPPFGTAGKTAMEHLAKAARHLREGGRIVAVIPEGSSMEKRFDAWRESEDSEGISLVAEFGMPLVTFERAGTGVKVRVVVLDKGGEADRQGRRDIQAETVKEFFEKLANVRVPERVAPAAVAQPSHLPPLNPNAPSAPGGRQPSSNEVRDGNALVNGGRGAVLAENAPPGGWTEADKVPSISKPTAWTTAEFTHTRDKYPVFVAKPVARMSKEDFDAARNRAKAAGGSYSSFKGAGAIPGFHFKSAEARDSFIAAENARGDALGASAAFSDDLFGGAGGENTGTSAAVSVEESGVNVRVGGQIVATLREKGGVFRPLLNANGERLSEAQKALVDGAAKDFSKDFQRRKLAELQGKKLTGTMQAQGDMLDAREGDAPLFGLPVSKAVADEGGSLFASVAFHGTPHEVDRFRLEKVGTGEGAQAYGWGLYFAENERVAEQYADALSAEKRAASPTGWWIIDGQTYDAIPNDWPDARREAALALGLDGKSAEAAIREATEAAEQNAGIPGVKSWLEDFRREVRALSGRIERVQRPKYSPNVYTVELDVEADELLDWDKPLSEQSEKVKDALGRASSETAKDRARMGLPAWNLNEEANTITGHGIYGVFTSWHGEKGGASRFLAAQGIPGIRYLDAGSRRNNASYFWDDKRDQWGVTYNNASNANQVETRFFASDKDAKAFIDSLPETYNYVIFDESKIRIVAKNGVPVGRGAEGKSQMADGRGQGADGRGDALGASVPAVDERQIEEEAARTMADVEKPPDASDSQGIGAVMYDAYARLLRGRKDNLEHFGSKAIRNVVDDAELDAAKVRAGIREMMDRMLAKVNQALGKSKDADGALRRKRFMAELLPTAARLNATGRDAAGNFVFGDFEMRAGSLSRKAAEAAGVSTGGVIERRGEFLRVGQYLDEQRAYQLFRVMPAARQRAIYEGFAEKYPETNWMLDLWINPDEADTRVEDARGTVLPEFNRFALRKFFGEASPFGELGEVEGYVPEVMRTRTLAGMAAAAVKNLLSKGFRSGAREYKTGEGRETGQVRDLFQGFSIRAMEAHAEAQRLATAEKLIPLALKDTPADGLPGGWLNFKDALARLAGPFGRAQGMTPEQLRAFTVAVVAGDMEALKKLLGAAWQHVKQDRQMIRQEVFNELVRPLADRQVRNWFMRIVDSMSKSYVGGLLAHPFSWVQNQLSNEFFKVMRAMQRALYAATVWVDGARGRREARMAGREAWELTKLALGGRWWNWKAVEELVPEEYFEGDNGITGAVQSITEQKMTALEHLKQANVPQALLTAAGYAKMDPRTKQQLAYASMIAQAQVAAQDAEKAGFVFRTPAQRSAWMKDWLRTKAGPEVRRRAVGVAKAYAMDYLNVPGWLDDTNPVMVGGNDITPIVNLFRRMMIPFAKWPYNLARQMKRFGLNSAADVALYVAGKSRIPSLRGLASAKGVGTFNPKMANSVAHLVTMGMLYSVARALVAGADDKDEAENLGRSFDNEGNRLASEFNTSSRVRLTGSLDKAVRALAMMHGDDGTKDDYWLRVRTLPYVSPMLAMAATQAAFTGPEREGEATEAMEMWNAFIQDFNSEGILSALMDKIGGKDSKWDQGVPLSTTAGQMATDFTTSRIVPAPVMTMARDLVDPQMRRTRPSESMDFNTGGPLEGAAIGVASRVPGLSKLLPKAGDVRTRNLENAMEPLAKIPAGERGKNTRIWTDEREDGTPVVKASYIDPEDERKIPRWKTLLRMAGANVKPVARDAYKRAVDGTESAYRRAMRKAEGR